MTKTKPRSTNRMRARDRKLLGELSNAPLVDLPSHGFEFDAPRMQGVYIIVHKRRGDVHVDRTTRGQNGLFQRLKNHLQGRSSFVRLFARPQRINVRRERRYRYLEVSNARARAFLEALATGTLCPAHIGTGEGARRRAD